MNPDQECIDFIKSREGLKLSSYQDSAGIWTIGYGTIVYETGVPVKGGQTITADDAEHLLSLEINKKSLAVDTAIHGVTLNQHQYNALVSFAYNAGFGALLGSTLLKRIKLNPDDPTIRDAFMMWDKAHTNGQLAEVDGLKNRREAEANLYFS